jgi:hypothetical protein
MAKPTFDNGLEKFMKKAFGHILSASFMISIIGGIIRAA